MSNFHNLDRFEALSKSLPLTGGKVFFVADSADAWFERLQRLFPVDVDGDVRLFSNLDTAVGACTASRGDVIVVFPDYTMTVTAAGSLALDVEGITLIGLGNGNDRPTISYTTAATGTVLVTAAYITMDNFRFIANGDTVDVNVAIDINTGGNFFTLKNSHAILTDTSAQMVRFIQTDSGTDYLKVENCVLEGDTTAGLESVIDIVSDNKGTIIKNNYISASTGDSRGLIHFTGADTAARISHCLITGNHLWNQTGDSLSYGIHKDSDGGFFDAIISHNNIRITSDSGDGWFRVHSGVNNASLFENYGVNVAGERGVIIGVVSST